MTAASHGAATGGVGPSADDGQPVRMPRAERRVQLLEAAREAFASRGFHAASMDEIAERAGVSKPVLYQHFPGKVELYLVLLDAEAALLVSSLERALRSTRDNRLRVGAAIGAYFSLADGETGHRLLFEPEMSADRSVRARVEAMEDRCAALIAEVIAEDTGVDPDEARLLSAGLCGMAILGASSWLRSGRPVPLEAAVADVARLAWKGISGFPHIAATPGT